MKSRKDERGRALRKGESQRASDKRYVYTFTDPQGRRKYIYARDLLTLREKEKKLMGWTYMRLAKQRSISVLIVTLLPNMTYGKQPEATMTTCTIGLSVRRLGEN